MQKIHFSYADVPTLLIKKKKNIKAFVQQIFEREGYELARLHYVFCSDEYLLQINQSHLQHDDYTDIITFDLSEPSGGTIGEIYISVERVRENSITHETPYKNEILRVVFHGALHLCGFKDKMKREITIMRQKEEEYLRLFEEMFQ